MKILGIDPGFRFAGFGVIEKRGNVINPIDYGCLKLKVSNSLALRLVQFHDFFYEKIENHRITHIAIETPFLGKNAQNFLKLGYLRGILYFLVEKNNVILFEFSPREVKKAITGFGGASKEQVARAITRLLTTIRNPVRDDVTDALAIAFYGTLKASVRNTMVTVNNKK